MRRFLIKAAGLAPFLVWGTGAANAIKVARFFLGDGVLITGDDVHEYTSPPIEQHPGDSLSPKSRRDPNPYARDEDAYVTRTAGHLLYDFRKGRKP